MFLCMYSFYARKLAYGKESFVKGVHCPVKSPVKGLDCPVKNRGKV